MIRFAAVEKETVLLNPLKNMARRTIASQVRFDPLTGRSARICHFMKLQWEKPDFDALVAGTDTHCPFCPQKVDAVTPCFDPELIPEGRLQREEMRLFPNLAPYDSIGAVLVMGAAHFVPLTGFRAEKMAAAFSFAIDFFRRIEAAGHAEAVYHLINWNYMPPAGSSIIHPHLQVFSTSTAPNLLRMEIEAGREFARRHGTCYWDELARREKALGQRYLGRIGATSWMTAYAPMGVAGDVVAVVDEAASPVELDEQVLLDLGRGLEAVMAAYDRMGIYSFNMNMFAAARADDFFRLHLVFSPRTFFNQALGATDVGALRNLYNETLCMAFPEQIADMLRPDFP